MGAATEKVPTVAARRYNTRSSSTPQVISLLIDEDSEEESMPDAQPREADGKALQEEAREQSDQEDHDYDFAYGDCDDDMGMAEVGSQPAPAANTAVREASSDMRLAAATGATRLLIKELRNLSKVRHEAALHLLQASTAA